MDKSKWIWWLHNRPHIFRCGPVPCIRHGRCLGRCYRKPHTTQELRSLSDPDHREYSRARRRGIPSTWDDIWFSNAYPKSWKDCTKKKKQWL